MAVALTEECRVWLSRFPLNACFSGWFTSPPSPLLSPLSFPPSRVAAVLRRDESAVISMMVANPRANVLLSKCRWVRVREGISVKRRENSRMGRRRKFQQRYLGINDTGLMASSTDCGNGCFRQNCRISSHVLWLPEMTVN